MLIWHEPDICQPASTVSGINSYVSQETFDTELGSILAECRRELGISQDYLSTILRRDQTFVSKLENGKRAITLFDFLRWGKALNLGYSEMLDIFSKLEYHVE